MVKKADEQAAGLRSAIMQLQWNELHGKARYPQPVHYVKITTELKVLTPMVDVPATLGEVQPLANYAWHPTPVPSLGLSQQAAVAVDLELTATPFANDLQVQTAGAEGLASGLTALMTAVYAQPGLLDAVEQEGLTEIDTARVAELGRGAALAPEAELAYLAPMNVARGPAKRPSPVGLLWEQAAALSKTAGQQVTAGVRHRYEDAQAFLSNVQKAIDVALLPPPGYGTAPVRVRGAVRTSGRSAQPLVEALVLDQDWNPGARLKLPVIRGPSIRANRLTMAVDVQDRALNGRTASLILVSSGAEVALVGAPIKASDSHVVGRAEFRIDLSTAQLSLADGVLSTDALHIVIEPPGSNPKEQGDRPDDAVQAERGPDV